LSTQPRREIARRKQQSLAVTKAPELLARLGEFSDEILVRYWRRGLELLKSLREDEKLVGQNLLAAIQEEWGKRGMVAVDGEFRWPTTVAPIGDGGLKLNGLPEQGVLKFMGYQVGRTNGIDSYSRRTILDRVFQGNLPLGILDRDGMIEWGAAGSAARLRKLANCLAGFCRNAKRRDEDALSDAIADWEADLDYLYHRYYVTMRSFSWPSVTVS
jgi:hypothetical protein